MVEILRGVNNPVNLNYFIVDDIENKIRVENQYSVSIFSQFGMSWDSAKMRSL